MRPGIELLQAMPQIGPRVRAGGPLPETHRQAALGGPRKMAVRSEQGNSVLKITTLVAGHPSRDFKCRPFSPAWNVYPG